MDYIDNKKDSLPLIDVALYLYGNLLNPTQVTSMLGAKPSKTRVKGEKWYTSTNKEVVPKIGVWELTAESQSQSLSDKIAWLRQRLDSAVCSPLNISGVEKVEVSIFVALGSNNEGALDYNSELTSKDLAWLSSIGAIVSFSITYTGD
jgi:hypothetical protein